MTDPLPRRYVVGIVHETKACKQRKPKEHTPSPSPLTTPSLLAPPAPPPPPPTPARRNQCALEAVGHLPAAGEEGPVSIDAEEVQPVLHRRGGASVHRVHGAPPADDIFLPGELDGERPLCCGGGRCVGASSFSFVFPGRGCR